MTAASGVDYETKNEMSCVARVLGSPFCHSPTALWQQVPSLHTFRVHEEF